MQKSVSQPPAAHLNDSHQASDYTPTWKYIHSPTIYIVAFFLKRKV